MSTSSLDFWFSSLPAMDVTYSLCSLLKRVHHCNERLHAERGGMGSWLLRATWTGSGIKTLDGALPIPEALMAELWILLLQVEWPGVTWMGKVGVHRGDSKAGSRPQRRKWWLALESLPLG